MRRVTMVLGVMTLMPLLMGAGGSAPPPPGLFLNRSHVDASIVIDPHETFGGPVTSSAKNGWIELRERGHRSATGVFQVPLFFPFFQGCDLTLTNARFVSTAANFVPMENWMNSDLVAVLFQQLGIATSAALNPAITKVVRQQCLPAAPSDTTGVPNPGLLSMDVEIGFWAPPGTAIPK